MSKTNGKSNGRGKPSTGDGKSRDDGRDTLGQFAPGVSGNPGGRPSSVAKLLFERAVKILESKGEDGIQESERLLRALVDRGCRGDTAAAKLILDRLWPATTFVDANIAGMTAEHARSVFDVLAEDYVRDGRLPDLTDRG